MDTLSEVRLVGIVLEELLRLPIGGLSRSRIPLTVLLPLILFFLPEDWLLLRGRLFPGTFLGS